MRLAILLVLLALPGCYSLDAQKRDIQEGRLEAGRQDMEAFLEVWGEPTNRSIRVVNAYDPYWIDPYWNGFYVHRRYWSLGYYGRGYYYGSPWYGRVRIEIEELFYAERNVVLTFSNGLLVGYRPIHLLDPMQLGLKLLRQTHALERALALWVWALLGKRNVDRLVDLLGLGARVSAASLPALLPPRLLGVGLRLSLRKR